MSHLVKNNLFVCTSVSSKKGNFVIFMEVWQCWKLLSLDVWLQGICVGASHRNWKSRHFKTKKQQIISSDKSFSALWKIGLVRKKKDDEKKQTILLISLFTAFQNFALLTHFTKSGLYCTFKNETILPVLQHCDSYNYWFTCALRSQNMKCRACCTTIWRL